MIKNWFKKILGLDELESRLQHIEKEKATLESKVIEAEIKKNELTVAVTKRVMANELNDEANKFFKEVNIQITEKNKDSALDILNAAEIVEKYQFKRYVAPIERGYGTPVISMKDFKEHPERYFHKLDKGFFNFPVGLNFKEINEILYKNKFMVKIDINGEFEFMLSSLLKRKNYSERSVNALFENALNQASNLSHINRQNCYKNLIAIDPLDYLANYNGIKQSITDLLDVDLEEKKNVIKTLELTKFVYLTAMEIIGTTRIKDLDELLNYKENEKSYTVTGEIEDLNPAQQLKLKLKSALLTNPKGTTDAEIEQMLPIRSRERFRELASEITSIILANDKDIKGLTYGIDKPLNEYSVGECLVLASYFARNIITQYKTLECRVKGVFAEKVETEITGKSTDYTGLALHYLREYLVPLQPDKFRNWKFGVQIDIIGNYGHCYIKAIHINEDLSADVYFIDPTKLAGSGIQDLKTPKDVLDKANAMNNPLLIKRDAEDLLYAAKEKMKKD